MSVTTEQYNRLIARLEAIEATINRIMSVMTTLASLDQLRQLHVVRQADIVDLQSRMTAAQNAIETLQESHRL